MYLGIILFVLRYAMALVKLMRYDMRLRRSSRHLVLEHVQKALDLNPLDPYVWQFLGNFFLEERLL